MTKKTFFYLQVLIVTYKILVLEKNRNSRNTDQNI